MFQRATSLWRRLTHRPSRPTPSQAAEVPEEDKRMRTRHSCDVETWCAVMSEVEEPRFRARIQDISLGGINFLAPRSFPHGALLSVELPGHDEQSVHTVLVCVIYAHEAGPEVWSIGSRFAAELTEADLKAFGAARTRSVLPDNRNWSRFPCNVRAVYHLFPDDGSARHEAKVLNISAGGVALAVKEDVKVGALLNADLQAASGARVVSVLACVVHVTAEPDQDRVLGCNFIEELSDEALRGLV